MKVCYVDIEDGPLSEDFTGFIKISEIKKRKRKGELLNSSTFILEYTPYPTRAVVRREVKCFTILGPG